MNDKWQLLGQTSYLLLKLLTDFDNLISFKYEFIYINKQVTIASTSKLLVVCFVWAVVMSCCYELLLWAVVMDCCYELLLWDVVMSTRSSLVDSRGSRSIFYLAFSTAHFYTCVLTAENFS